jgi:hypothetical protein
LARALKMQGDVQKSRAAYEQFFAFWKNADPDNLVVARANLEFLTVGK